MLRIVLLDRRGWSSLFGGLALGAVSAVAYFHLVRIEDSWMALAPVAVAVLFAGIPFGDGPRRVGPLSPWRYVVLGLGLALSAGVLVGAGVGG